MKKRFMFTLTKETVEEFQALTKEIGLPPATLSNEIDRFIKEILVMTKKARAQGSFTLKDMLHMMGEQVELALMEGPHDEKRKEKVKEGKGTKCPDCGEVIRAFDWCPHCNK